VTTLHSILDFKSPRNDSAIFFRFEEGSSWTSTAGRLRGWIIGGEDGKVDEEPRGATD
jgi:hypothetical protein